MHKFVGAVVAFLSGTTQAYLRFGACPNPEPMAEFDTSRYMGRWYETARDALDWYESAVNVMDNPYKLQNDCAVVDYDLIEGTDFFQVHDKHMYLYLFWYEELGQAIQSN